MKTLSVAAVAAFSTLALAAPAAHAATPSTARATSASASTTPTTQLTLEVRGCEGCTVGVASYLQDSVTIWDDAKPKEVRDGAVTFAVPTDRTAGLSITVRAPWEGATGYVTNVALRYKGEQTGDPVGFKAARAAIRGTSCWAGTTEDTATMKIVVRKVQVEGYGGKVPGTLAFTRTTQDWLRPLVRSWHGVIGTQDLMPCK